MIKFKDAFLKTVWFPHVRVRTFAFFGAGLLLCTLNCTRMTQIVESDAPYHTETFKKVCAAWSREDRIHRGLEVELIVSATFKSEEFRRAYADEYARAYMLTPEAKKQFLEAQLMAATHGHDFLMASFVPERNWDDFGKASSMWRLYLVNDQNERVVPVEVRKVKRKDAVIPHFFPYITPWKSTYTIRFPYNIPATDLPIIKDTTKSVRLVITSVLGSAEMEWKLEPQKRAHSPQVLPDGSASRAAELASKSENGKLPYGRREALPSGRTFPAACCGELQ